jgi:phosphatidylinositol glycan class C protein
VYKDWLLTAVYTETYGLGEVILVSGVVTQELSSVCVFVGIYWFVQENWLSPLSLLSLLLTAAGGAVLLAGWRDRPRASQWNLVVSEYVKPSAIFVSFLVAVSPILKTLTESISTDTIWAMTVGMLLVHLVFFDYGSHGPIVSSSISLNASIFSSVCLASRLPSSLHAFVVVSLAVLVFALFPEFRNRFKDYHTAVFPLTTVAMVVFTVAILSAISLVGVVFYILGVLSITFLCPLLFVRLQHLKNNIYGPWDEAAINL